MATDHGASPSPEGDRLRADEDFPSGSLGTANEACLYTVLRSPQTNHDGVLREFVTPIVRTIQSHPSLHSLFFVRYNEPVWQVRFRVLGRPAWIESSVRPLIERAVEPILASGLVSGVEFGEYAREWDRYGGPTGMRLAEQIFRHDSIACLDLLEAEARGQMSRSRREYSLVHTERLLDLCALRSEERLRFYEYGYRWAFDEGSWNEGDVARLDERYESLREGLFELLRGAGREDPVTQLGGPVPERIGHACVDATRPALSILREALAAGKVSQDLVNLAWSYAHMHANRLGIDTSAEAILRYFMYRFHRDERNR